MKIILSAFKKILRWRCMTYIKNHKHPFHYQFMLCEQHATSFPMTNSEFENFYWFIISRPIKDENASFQIYATVQIFAQVRT